jgi:hypothetical protein
VLSSMRMPDAVGACVVSDKKTKYIYIYIYIYMTLKEEEKGGGNYFALYFFFWESEYYQSRSLDTHIFTQVIELGNNIDDFYF